MTFQKSVYKHFLENISLVSFGFEVSNYNYVYKTPFTESPYSNTLNGNINNINNNISETPLLVQIGITLPEVNHLNFLSALRSFGYFKTDYTFNKSVGCFKGELGASGLVVDYGCHAVDLPDRCGQLFCPKCSKLYRYKTKKRVVEKVLSMRNPRFLTFSGSNVSELSKEYFQNNSKIWNRFKTDVNKDFGCVFQDYVNVIEVKFHAKGSNKYDKNGSVIGVYDSNSWNIHNHIIYDGKYLDFHTARNYLLKASKGRYKAIWFEKANNVQDKVKSAGYISKYLLKASGFGGDVQAMAQFYFHTKNMRMVTFGRSKDVYVPSLEEALQFPQTRSLFTCPLCNKKVSSVTLSFVRVKDRDNNYKDYDSPIYIGVIEDSSQRLLNGSDEVLRFIESQKGVMNNALEIEKLFGVDVINDLKSKGFIYESKINYLEVLK
ncbi:MAG: hypothetical protein KKB65_01740 [Nanoarchaeota archaeon]|nr:hypothetical protein [Nanoarchaeota archaeon]